MKGQQSMMLKSITGVDCSDLEEGLAALIFLKGNREQLALDHALQDRIQSLLKELETFERALVKALCIEVLLECC
jgi:hypothetical protein